MVSLQLRYLGHNLYELTNQATAIAAFKSIRLNHLTKEISIWYKVFIKVLKKDLN
jgi:hypothetical protein